ncbi:hypothetical protein C8Q72DRAFT_38992 [Fomitopsis betulina]|nr:hypothetical protein C8Q72DRAFT_38992 [Fomitopsis betulina]
MALLFIRVTALATGCRTSGRRACCIFLSRPFKRAAPYTNPRLSSTSPPSCSIMFPGSSYPRWLPGLPLQAGNDKDTSVRSAFTMIPTMAWRWESCRHLVARYDQGVWREGSINSTMYPFCVTDFLHSLLSNSLQTGERARCVAVVRRSLPSRSSIKWIIDGRCECAQFASARHMQCVTAAVAQQCPPRTLRG